MSRMCFPAAIRVCTRSGIARCTPERPYSPTPVCVGMICANDEAERWGERRDLCHQDCRAWKGHLIRSLFVLTSFVFFFPETHFFQGSTMFGI